MNNRLKLISSAQPAGLIHDMDNIPHTCDPPLTAVHPPSDTGMAGMTVPHTAVMPHSQTNLSHKQALVLEHLVKNVSRRTSYNIIGMALGFSKSAVRDAVAQLARKKFISKPVTIRDGVFQGFEYWLDSVKSDQFMEAGGAANKRYQQSMHSITPPIHTVCPPSGGSHHSSSCYEKQLTTKTEYFQNPELHWWFDHGLTHKLVMAWLEEFYMTIEDLTLALKYARYDIVENKINSNGKPIENPINWIFAILKKSGAYTPPKNYQSIYELRAKLLEDQDRRDEVARQKIKEAEFEIEFREFMRNPDSPIFQELLAEVGEFARDNPFALEIAMKELFREKEQAPSRAAELPRQEAL